MGKELTKKQEDEIIRLYVGEKKSMETIKKDLHVSRPIIKKILLIKGIGIRPGAFQEGHPSIRYWQGKHREMKHCQTCRQFLSEGHKCPEVNSFKGKHHKEETKEIWRENRLGKTWEEIYGKDEAKRLHKIAKERESPNKGKKFPKEKYPKWGWRTSRKKQVGENHPMYGKPMKPYTKKKLIEARAKQILPVKDTSIEIKIQNFLKELGIEFYTHQYMKIYYAYQCDIYIPKQVHVYEDGSIIEIKQPTIVECDGDYWHGNPEHPYYKDFPIKVKAQRCLDFERTEQLKLAGYNAIRLFGSEIRPMQLNEFKERLK